MRSKTFSGVLFVVVVLLFAFQSGIQAQCDVTAIAYPQVICAGDNVTLSATGGCGLLMSNDFENGTIGVGWSSTGANPVFTNPCGLGPAGIYCWVGVTPSNTRTLITVDYDVSIGGCEVEWYMRYGEVLNNDPCEDPDQPNEGVNLQWSTNGGMTWTDFPGVNQYPQGQNHYTNNGAQPDDLLGTTTTPGTGGQWHPTHGGTHGGNFPPGMGSVPWQPSDNTFYWHLYESPVPLPATTPNTRFRWAQLSNSGSGWDAWGIDEVFIRCPTGNLSVLWSHGPTLLNPPAVTLPDQGGVPYDTCFTVTINDTINSASAQVCITVNPVPSSHFSISDTSLCTGDTTTLTYTGQATTVAHYNWNIAGTSASGQGPHVQQFITPGQKNISLSVSESGCMSGTTHKTLTVHPKPTVSFMPTPFAVCIGSPILFDNQSDPVNSNWYWEFGDGNTSTDMSPEHCYGNPGTYPVSLYVETPEGCENELKNVNIQVHPNPIAVIDTNWINFAGNTLEFYDKSQPGSGTITNWLWDFGAGASPSTSGSSSQIVTYPGQGKYTTKMVVTNSHGCKDSTRMEITIYKLQIPNVITPPNPPNERFMIDAIEEKVLTNVTLVIFNRWGKKVYENPNYDNSWNADGLAEGTYFYILSFASPRGQEKFHGTITVLRE